MKRPHVSWAVTLVLGFGACSEPQQNQADSDLDAAPARVGEAVEQAADEFSVGVREAMNDLGEKFDDLQASSASLQGESAAAWAETREEIVEAREELMSDLDRLQTATAEEVDQIHTRMAGNLETMTHRVERAELLATDGNEQFVAEAQERLAEVDQDIQTLEAEAAELPLEAREGASRTVETLRRQANDVRESLNSIVAEAPQQIAEKRDAVADDVAALAASVRREHFEMQSSMD